MSWPRPAAGAHQALTARGLPTRSDWFFAGDFSLESGKHCATEWMALQHRPSAVFCASDEMACGFIGEVQRRGLLVPKDVSVVGFDNIDLVAHITHALTTISQPHRAIG
jgi:LacI family transcriptional regulator, repressor for deo operon, udp, cdd, tsx, nupC, and nupG